MTSSVKLEKDSKADSNLHDELQFKKSDLKYLINSIKDWNLFNRKCKILEMSDPNGLYSIELCRMNTNISATIFMDRDQGSIMETVKGQVGVSERVLFHRNELSSLELESFDMVIVSHILYNCQDQIESKITEILKLLKPGGVLISNHLFVSPSRKDQSDLSRPHFIPKQFLDDPEQFKGFIEANFTYHLYSINKYSFGDCHLDIGIK